MDKMITFRFYEVKRHTKKHVTFADALNAIHRINKKVDREQQLTADFYVRLELLETEPGNVLVGEITRIQKTNMPSEIQGERRVPLQTKNPLGHGVVFRYLPTKSILGIQYDTRIASPGRFIQYIQQIVDGSSFDLEPIVRNDMWSRFNQGPSRKVVIGIARPEHLDELQRGPAQAASTSFRNMAEAYDSPTITIELSMGQKKGSLSEKTKGLVKYFRDKFVNDEIEVRKLKATVKDGGAPKDEIDLLEDILAVKKSLNLHDNNPDENYKIKKLALKEQTNEWIA